MILFCFLNTSTAWIQMQNSRENSAIGWQANAAFNHTSSLLNYRIWKTLCIICNTLCIWLGLFLCCGGASIDCRADGASKGGDGYSRQDQETVTGTVDGKHEIARAYNIIDQEGGDPVYWLGGRVFLLEGTLLSLSPHSFYWRDTSPLSPYRIYKAHYYIAEVMC